jgi:DNA transposition AAA+ family ATPase
MNDFAAQVPTAISKLTPDEQALWREATTRTKAIVERHSWTTAELARRADIPAPTLTTLMAGSYAGDIPKQVARLVKWLDSFDSGQALAAQLPTVPDWIMTPTAKEVLDTLRFAQLMPDMVVITLGSGMGKTMTAAHYCAISPSAWRVTMRPTTSSVGTMLLDIAQALDVPERHSARIDRAIGQRLKRNGRQTLLILDEAQNLSDKAVDQLRFFLDEFGCGLALIGNNELYKRAGFGEPKEGFGQIHRRVGTRLARLKPLDGDIEALIGAWKVEDEQVAKLLRAIGRKPGALGQITKTMQGAAILAAGEGVPINASHIRAAWERRSAGEAH